MLTLKCLIFVVNSLNSNIISQFVYCWASAIGFANTRYALRLLAFANTPSQAAYSLSEYGGFFVTAQLQSVFQPSTFRISDLLNFSSACHQFYKLSLPYCMTGILCEVKVFILRKQTSYNDLRCWIQKKQKSCVTKCLLDGNTV